MKLKKIMESAEEINTAVIPAAIKIKFEKALELMNGKELSYNQKIKLLAKIIDMKHPFLILNHKKKFLIGFLTTLSPSRFYLTNNINTTR